MHGRVSKAVKQTVSVSGQSGRQNTYANNLFLVWQEGNSVPGMPSTLLTRFPGWRQPQISIGAFTLRYVYAPVAFAI